MNEQISFLPLKGEDTKELSEQAKILTEYAKKKRNWENAFQRWSDKHGMGVDNTESYGCCGYGSMCEWCDDDFTGRPCVRALNAMCREKGTPINYDVRNFETIWSGVVNDD